MKIAATGLSGAMGTHFKTVAPYYGMELVPLDQRYDVLLLMGWPSDVDQCQRDPDWAWSAVDNIEPLLRLSRGSRVVFISSDMVAGHSVYGATKRLGEALVKTYHPSDHLIVRAQSLYGRGGKTWASKIREKFLSHQDISAVDDQVVQPTWYGSFVDRLAEMIWNKEGGTHSVASSGSCTWFDFALRMRYWWDPVLPAGTVRPITSASLNRPAPRLAKSVFPNSHIGTWEEQLKEYMLSEDQETIREAC